MQFREVRGELGGIEFGERADVVTEAVGVFEDRFVVCVQRFQGEDEALRAAEENIARFVGYFCKFIAGRGQGEAQAARESGVEILFRGAAREPVGVLLRDGERGRVGRRIDARERAVERRNFREQPGEAVPLRERLFVAVGIVRQFPTGLAQGDGLADEPRARAAPFRIAPVHGFIDGLTIELENEVGMAGGGEVGIDVLVTGDAGICADVEIFQIAHAGADAGRISPIGPGMSAQPILRGAMATLARNRFARHRGRGALRDRDGVEGRVTSGAAGAGLRGCEAVRLLR